MEPGEELVAIAGLNVAKEKVFSLERSEEFGRLVVATKDLGVGDLIMEEHPLSYAPMLDSPPVCLTCAALLQRGGYRCPGCGWPMCGSKCAQAAVHRDQECRIYRNAKKKLDCSSWNFSQQQPLYTLVTVLRVLSLEPQAARVAGCLESHLHLWRERQEFSKYTMIVDYMKNTLQMAVDKSTILSILASSFTNDFSHSEAGTGEQHMMLPLTAMLNHSCFPNISRCIRKLPGGGFLMRVVAARTIKKGEQIFNCYTDMLDPVQVRRAGLQEAKNMDCRCERCEDPRDLGSLGSAVVCPSCRGALLPGGQVWTCAGCGETRPKAKVDELVFVLNKQQKEVLGDPQKKRIEVLEKLLGKWGKVLHPRNLLLVRLRYNLVGLYGRQPGYSQEEMTEALWERKRELCEDVMVTLKVLEPGMTVRKARLLQELHLPLLMLAQLHLSQGRPPPAVKKEFQRGLITLGLATRVFEGEPEGSWERQTALRNLETSAQVTQIMAGL